ncbi:Metallo-dependent phosphatase [Artomyces pyxidatus]|uniref:Metallo-dependent phosphatase n=1 Tax=Artomyces pyxidatus TaxID=48021 RepID=A0ACB8TJT2_9AGAM|nr:Metallo-dependent phosphatase [Artomyces pyxidatus]
MPGAVIHSAYDLSAVPPKPTTGNWARFVCISDTHEHVFPVPDGDVLLHSGDLTSTGTLGGTKITMDWLCSLPHPQKVIIAGNHDLTFHRDWYETAFYGWHREKENTSRVMEHVTGTKARNAGVVYLENGLHELQTRPNGRKWTVYGSPWTPEFFSWAFNYDRGQEARKIISSFSKADILLTHGPPHGILDRVTSGMSVGCESLLARLPELRPRLHVFGHIHEAHGVQIGEWVPPTPTSQSNEQSVFVNAANWPAGSRSRGKDGRAVSFGSGEFQPIIVDLLEDL